MGKQRMISVFEKDAACSCVNSVADRWLNFLKPDILLLCILLDLSSKLEDAY